VDQKVGIDILITTLFDNPWSSTKWVNKLQNVIFGKLAIFKGNLNSEKSEYFMFVHFPGKKGL
jgi:hypothetical protein